MAGSLFNWCWPESSGFVQPLAAELALRTNLLRPLPFATGHGLDLAMLLTSLCSWAFRAWRGSTSANGIIATIPLPFSPMPRKFSR
jgi:hypothetical protein